jgi:NDP-sugar pyrophosphorylase family protein
MRDQSQFLYRKDLSNMQLIIPMSGSGKRFRDQGYTDPKPLIEVDGSPMIHHVLNLFPGVTDVVFICSREDIRDTNMESVLMGICPTAKIIQIDRHKKGPVWAVAQAFDVIEDDEEVLVSYCDYGTRWNFERFLLEVRRDHFDGSVICYRHFHPHMLGSDNYAFCREKDGVLLEIKEKEPFTDNKMNEYASNGSYYFSKGALVKKYFRELIDRDINVNGEYYVSLVYNLMTRDGLRTKIFEIDNMIQLGTPGDLKTYQGWSTYFSDRDWTLILPMGGHGARFADVGYQTPKPLLPVDGVPMFVKAVDCLPDHKRSVFICHRQVKSHVKEHYPNAMRCIIDSVTDGQATTCEMGIHGAGVSDDEPILISACDNAAVYDNKAFRELVRDKTNDVIVWSFKDHPSSKMNPNMYSWLDVDPEGLIRDVSCKKFVVGRGHAIIGTMYFRKAKYFLDGLKANREQNIRTNGEFYVDDVLNQNIKSGLKVKVFAVDDYICWGTPNDYKTYQYWKSYFEQ